MYFVVNIVNTVEKYFFVRNFVFIFLFENVDDICNYYSVQKEIIN